MPSLQDMLEEFDASRLEELAESLLADVITDLAEDNATGCSNDAQGTSTVQRQLGPMVGTQTKLMESASNTNGSVRSKLTTKTSKKTTDERRLGSSSTKPTTTQKNPTIIASTQKHRRIATKPENTSTILESSTPCYVTIPPVVAQKTVTDSETLYGTYDERTNCITIVLPDENISISEAVEEISSDDEQQKGQNNHHQPMDFMDECVQVEFPTISDDHHYAAATDLNDCHSDGTKSIYGGGDSAASVSLASESGYESLGSPSSSVCNNDIDTMHFDDMWNSSFSELFPSLL